MNLDLNAEASENSMNIDLNAEPSDSRPLESLIEYRRAEQRLECLRQLASRAIQQQRGMQGENAPRNSPSMRNVSLESTSAVAQTNVRMPSGDLGAVTQDTMPQHGNFSSGSHLVVKALDMDAKGKEASSTEGQFFDCNICLKTARDPILTCCGHLFCWPCFFQLAYVFPGIRECPVCYGAVKDENIIPIYGSDSSPVSLTSKMNQAGIWVPPRPQAHRIECRRR